jgi:pimeloyl-ACP methyl ester carboxylesterase
MSQRSSNIIRNDLKVTSDPGMSIAVREVIWNERTSPSSALPVLLVHGGGGGGIPSFDNPAAHASVAEDLALSGSSIYLLDIRGWGASTRPPQLERAPDEHPPAVSSEEAVRDIAAVVEFVCERLGVEAVALVGWASGGHWAGMYASRHPDRVDKLVLLNSLYGVAAPWSMQSAFEDKDRPGAFDRSVGAYALRSAQSLLGAWERTIPIDDKDAWRDPGAANAYARLTIASDPTSSERTPLSVRTPTGFQNDSFAMSLGHRFWEASDITADVLVARGTADFWSRPEDVSALQRELTNARSVQTIEIEGGTHFLFLDRPERGRQAFIDAVIRFLGR